MKLLICSVVASLATTTALEGAAPSPSTTGLVLPTQGPATFDVAGVRLGMAPAAVRQALAKTGYRIERVDQNEDFQGEVSDRIDDLRRHSRTLNQRSIGEIVAVGPSTERIDVAFEQWPEGAKVVAVSFALIGSDRQTPDALKAQVEGRYGKPTMPITGARRWCSAGEKQCGPLGQPSLPTLDADYYARTLYLKPGTDAQKAHRDLVEAEARKIVPLQSGSAF